MTVLELPSRIVSRQATNSMHSESLYQVLNAEERFALAVRAPALTPVAIILVLV